MKITVSELIEMGFAVQADKLAKQLMKNNEKRVIELAQTFNKLPGVIVNDSFFKQMHKTDFSDKEIQEALIELGVDLDLIKGKKWYQFWLNNSEVKLLNSIKSIK